MNRRQICLGLGLLLLLLAACSIPALAYSESNDIPGTPFRSTIDTSFDYLEIDVSNISIPYPQLELNASVINKIDWFINEENRKQIKNLTLSENITTIKSGTFKGFTELKSLKFSNTSPVTIEQNAFPVPVNQIDAGEGISRITTKWGVQGDHVDFRFSAVHNDSMNTPILVFDPPVKEVFYSHPWYNFTMPGNRVSVKILETEEIGPTKAGTSVSYMTCRINISAASNIELNVTANNYNYTRGYSIPSYYRVNSSNPVSIDLYGDDNITITALSYPSGHFLTSEVDNISFTNWDGDTISFISYTQGADYGNASIRILSSPKPNPSPTSSPSKSPENTKFTPVDPADNPSSSEAAIDGIVTSTGDSRATIEDVSSTYPGVSSAANTAISCNGAIMGVTSGGLDLLTSGLSSEAAAKVTDIITNAVAKGILTPSTSSLPLVMDLGDTGTSSGDVTPVKFYKVFDITPYSGEDSLRQVDFAVPLADISAAGCSPADVVLYHGYPDDNLWVPLETAMTSSDGSSAHYSAKTNGASPFAIVFLNQNTVIVPGEPIDKVFASPWTPVIRIIVIVSVILAAVAVGAVIVVTVLKYTGRKNTYPIYRKYRKASRSLYKKYRK